MDWIESKATYVIPHVGRREHLVRSNLTALEKDLDPSRFARIHRTRIVNISRIRRVVRTRHGDSRIALENANVLGVSWRYKARLDAAIQNSV